MTALLLVATGGLATTATSAEADGPSTFSNSASIPIPATGSANQEGPASPYSSTVAVAGLAGLVSDVEVTFHNLSHAALMDVDALLVAPTGENIVVLSDLGAPNQLTTASNAPLTFGDGAAGPAPAVLVVPSGTYKPTNVNVEVLPDEFPAVAPAPSSQTTLAGAFTGISPNGVWQLFVVDDNTGDQGR